MNDRDQKLFGDTTDEIVAALVVEAAGWTTAQPGSREMFKAARDCLDRNAERMLVRWNAQPCLHYNLTWRMGNEGGGYYCDGCGKFLCAKIGP